MKKYKITNLTKENLILDGKAPLLGGTSVVRDYEKLPGRIAALQRSNHLSITEVASAPKLDSEPEVIKENPKSDGPSVAVVEPPAKPVKEPNSDELIFDQITLDPAMAKKVGKTKVEELLAKEKRPRMIRLAYQLGQKNAIKLNAENLKEVILKLLFAEKEAKLEKEI